MSSTSSAALLRALKRDLAAVKEEAKANNGVRVTDSFRNLAPFCR